MNEFISIICPEVKNEDIEKIICLTDFLVEKQYKFEILIINDHKSVNENFLRSVKEKLTNSFLYTFASTDIEKLVSSGLELSVGDLIFEFYNIDNLLDEFKIMINLYLEEKEDFTIYNNNNYVIDKIISGVATQVFKSKIKTMINFPRVSKRESLNTWLEIKSKHKIIKLAPFLKNNEIKYVKLRQKITYSKKRHLRESLRSIIYVTTAPLRLVTFLSLVGSAISMSVSFYVLYISLTTKVVEGWTTTNLIISVSVFFILVTLGIISEYLNQIISNTKTIGHLQIHSETSSNSKSYTLNDNVEEL